MSTPPRRLRMIFDVPKRMLVVEPDDLETKEWLRRIPIHLFAELGELGRQIQRPCEPLRVDEPPELRAAEYQARVSELFHDERIEVRAVLRHG